MNSTDFLAFLTFLVIALALSQDRKSTRLNSSHLVISYAVFCLKKKTVYFYYLARLNRSAPRFFLEADTGPDDGVRFKAHALYLCSVLSPSALSAPTGYNCLHLN